MEAIYIYQDFYLPINLNFLYLKVKPLVPRTSNLRDSTIIFACVFEQWHVISNDVAFW